MRIKLFRRKSKKSGNIKAYKDKRAFERLRDTAIIEFSHFNSDQYYHEDQTRNHSDERICFKAMISPQAWSQLDDTGKKSSSKWCLQ